MNIVKANYTNAKGYFNAGRAFENELTQTFPSFVKSGGDDDNNGIDGTLTYKGEVVSVQLKCALHSDGGADPRHGYSVAHKTTQRKLRNVKYIVFALPEVESYTPYKLNHSLGIVYVINRAQAIKRGFLTYNRKGEIYIPQKSRLILNEMVNDGVADPIDIITII